MFLSVSSLLVNFDENVENEEKFYVQLQSILDNNTGRLVIIFYLNVRVDNKVDKYDISMAIKEKTSVQTMAIDCYTSALKIIPFPSK